MEDLRARVQRVAVAQGDYSGLPMLVHNHRITMARRHRWASRLEGKTLGPSEDRKPRSWECTTEDTGEGQLVREFWSDRLNTTVYIVQHGRPGDAGWKVELVYDPMANAKDAYHRWDRTFRGLEIAVDAWDLDAEMRALGTLSELITANQFKLYMLTGMFPEQSKRSRCAYVFRKGRPTVVLQPCSTGSLAARTVLCLHPLAYYHGTHAGGMVPTDDVIAHVMLMRADEARYWRVANQHPLHGPLSGI